MKDAICRYISDIPENIYRVLYIARCYTLTNAVTVKKPDVHAIGKTYSSREYALFSNFRNRDYKEFHN